MRFLSIPALLGAILAGCSGGGGSSSTGLSAKCPGGSSFCLTACNLGCVQGGCTISEIAQNQPISLEFSQMVDPATVTPASLSIKTASGESPVGSFRVERNKITFEPDILISGGSTFFGFQAGKVYIVSLPGGANEQQSIRSTSGDRINAPVNCTLTVSQGIVDLNRAAPSGELVAPTAKSGVSVNVTIMVKFSELIDTSPFQGSSTIFSPIKYQVRAPVRDANGDVVFDPDTGEPLCDASFPPVLIDGVPQATVVLERVVLPDGEEVLARKSVVSLRPTIPLPSQSCIEVLITDQVRDLSGRTATPSATRFLTEAIPASDKVITEDFERGSNLDRVASSGRWDGFRAIPGNLGGDGRHGSFDVEIGVRPDPLNQPDLWIWNTDNMLIPGALTLSGQDETVTDGRFFFSDFILDEKITLIFQGSNPLQIFVRGKAEISGIMQANGSGAVLPFSARPGNTPGEIAGQRGGGGGPGGGRGGNGGDSGDGNSAEPRFGGQHGDDVQLPAGHAYLSRATGTGGRGSPQHPASGLAADVTYGAVFNTASGMIGAGGGGGGFEGAGSGGQALSNPSGSLPGDLGPPSVGGAGIDLFNIPPGTSSLEHFAIGGSGGGGGGSHTFLASTAFPLETWRAGAGGGGGGGTVTIRAGNEVRVLASGRIEVRGASAGGFFALNQGFPQPGGGGSGGAILLQSDIPNGIVQGGTLDASGGLGGISFAGGLTAGQTVGGAGAPGFIRMETPGGTIEPGNTIPPNLTGQNLAVLTDTDAVSGAQSLWFTTVQFFPPEFLRYEIEVEIDGQLTLLSDDPNVSPLQANDPSGPLRARFQAASVNPTSREADPETIGPWRDFVGSGSGQQETLNLDEGTGFRFVLIFNRTMTQDIVVRRVSVFFRS